MDESFIPGALLGFLFGVLAFCVPWKLACDDLKSKAIERGAAEWLVDQKTGTTTFTWKELK